VNHDFCYDRRVGGLDVDRAFALGRAAFPAVALDRDAFAAYLDERSASADAAHAADLYLACACVLGVPRAADAFVARHLDKLPAYLGRLARSADFVAEVKQVLATRLLVGTPDGPPHVAEYNGRGALEGFVRVAATRTALNLIRHEGQRRASFTEAVERQLVDGSEDLGHLKAAYREPFRRALADAARALAREHRLLLVLHYGEGMTTAQVASLQQVSRPTIVRRIGAAREALLGDVFARLRAALQIGDEELAGILPLVRSQLDVSLVRLLRQSPG
jgi:RNA polymerase sigma-70 factor (ECF subfamily)